MPLFESISTELIGKTKQKTNITKIPRSMDVAFYGLWLAS